MARGNDIASPLTHTHTHTHTNTHTYKPTHTATDTHTNRNRHSQKDTHIVTNTNIHSCRPTEKIHQDTQLIFSGTICSLWLGCVGGCDNMILMYDCYVLAMI